MAPNGYTNAPAGQTPAVTPGAGNLTIAFASTNTGSVAGNLNQQIITSDGTVLAQSSAQVAPMGTNLTTTWTGTMPNSQMTITINVTP